MRILLICLVLLSSLLACKERPLVYERQEIKGKLVLKDGFAETPTVPAPDATLYLSLHPTIEQPYLYKVTVADKEGKFTIPFQPTNLRVGESLYLIARHTDKAGLLYESSMLVANLLPGANVELEVALTPLYPKYVLKVKVVDKAPKNEPVNKTDVYLFLNESQATTINDAEPKGFTHKQTTNEQGIAFFSGLENRQYYIRTKTTTPTGTVPGSKLESAVASEKDPTKIVSITIPLTYTISKNILEITVVHGSTGAEPLANFDAFLFTSLIQASTVVQDTLPKGRIQRVKTNSKGIATFTNLDDGTYYVGVRGDLSVSRTGTAVSGGYNLSGNRKHSYTLPVP